MLPNLINQSLSKHNSEQKQLSKEKSGAPGTEYQDLGPQIARINHMKSTSKTKQKNNTTYYLSEMKSYIRLLEIIFGNILLITKYKKQQITNFFRIGNETKATNRHYERKNSSNYKSFSGDMFQQVKFHFLITLLLTRLVSVDSNKPIDDRYLQSGLMCDFESSCTWHWNQPSGNNSGFLKITGEGLQKFKEQQNATYDGPATDANGNKNGEYSNKFDIS